MNLSLILNKKDTIYNSKSCSLGSCMLCNNGVPKILSKKKNMGNKIYVSMYTISKRLGVEWVKLHDLYSFFLTHRKLLSLGKISKVDVMKQVKDTLNHCEYFISTPKLIAHMYKDRENGDRKNGYWSLLFNRNPWCLKGDQFIIKKIVKIEKINLLNSDRTTLLLNEYHNYIEKKESI